MKTLGLDIGTTSISAVVMENGQIVDSRTRKNDTFIIECREWERLQDPDIILEVSVGLVKTLFELYPDIAGIGVTGQMHGIVYLDRCGNTVSPLYTWQDGRGDLQYGTYEGKAESYAEYLSRITGYRVGTGYGAVTHFYNMKNGIVPESSAVFCTIQDYIAMVLGGADEPVTDGSDAASLGMYDLRRKAFDTEALQRTGMDPDFFPKKATQICIGKFEGRADVFTAIGDNQASFLGAVSDLKNQMLVNVGTGSQFSVYSPDYMECEGLETRPFPDGGYLIVGASLCGGRAYALLERFFWMTGQMLGKAVHKNAAEEFEGEQRQQDCYAAMELLLSESGRPDDLPEVETLFQGTREQPKLRGSIQKLSVDNFTPKHLIWAWMEGMACELNGMYLNYLRAGGKKKKLIGSGNGIRKNRFLKECFEDVFKEQMVLTEHVEEAACGAAKFAANL